MNATAPLGNWSQDFGLFTDYKDGRSYALYSNGDRREARDVYVTRYDEDVAELEEVVYRFPKFDLEAPSIVQTDKSYYAILSHKTGYRPNNVVAFRADSLAGPWSQPWIINALNTRGFNSQSGNTLRIKGTKQTTNLYIGDQVSFVIPQGLCSAIYLANSGTPTPIGKADISGSPSTSMTRRRTSVSSGTTCMT